MSMNETYRNAIANHGASLAKYIGLTNNGVELTGGTYARKAVTWTTAADGVIRPTADLVFDVPAGAAVNGWRAYSAATAGTDYGGAALPEETFNGAGQYKLLAANTGILHNVGNGE